MENALKEAEGNESHSPAFVVKGTVRAIPSKSFAHRQLICAALAERETKICCRVISEDISATVRCLSALGASIDFNDGVISVTPITSPKRGAVLDCGERIDI